MGGVESVMSNFITDKELQQTRVHRALIRAAERFTEHAKMEAQEFPHGFVSISSSQHLLGWKRHNCATCGLDYNDPIHNPEDYSQQPTWTTWANGDIVLGLLLTAR